MSTLYTAISTQMPFLSNKIMVSEVSFSSSSAFSAFFRMFFIFLLFYALRAFSHAPPVCPCRLRR